MRSASAGVTLQPVSSRPPDSRSIHKPAIGVEHHLDDAGIFQVGGDRRPERGAQHARAAGEGFRSEGNRRHSEPRKFASLGGACVSGVD